MELPAEARASLIEELIVSLEPDPMPEDERVLDETIRRRIKELEAGTARTEPWDEVHEQMWSKLRRSS